MTPPTLPEPRLQNQPEPEQAQGPPAVAALTPAEEQPVLGLLARVQAAPGDCGLYSPGGYWPAQSSCCRKQARLSFLAVRAGKVVVDYAASSSCSCSPCRQAAAGQLAGADLALALGLDDLLMEYDDEGELRELPAPLLTPAEAAAAGGPLRPLPPLPTAHAQAARLVGFLNAVALAHPAPDAEVTGQVVRLLEDVFGAWADVGDEKFPALHAGEGKPYLADKHPLRLNVGASGWKLFNAWLEARRPKALETAARVRLAAEKAARRARLLEKGYTPMTITAAPPKAEPLVEGLFRARHALYIGGPIKTLKSFILLDLAVSLAGGLPFLGRWPVPRRRRVLVFSGESGDAAVYGMVERAAASRGLDRAAAEAGGWLTVYERKMPDLGSKEGLEEFRDVIRLHDAEVACVDPIYLAFPGAPPGVWSSVMEGGPVARAPLEVCREEGCTFVGAHHVTDSAGRGRQGEPHPDQLSYVFKQLAAQWLMLGRRAGFDFDAGLHKLKAVHGCRGYASGKLWIDAAEGPMGADYSRPSWEVSFPPPKAKKAAPPADAGGAEEKPTALRLVATDGTRDDYQARVLGAYQKAGLGVGGALTYSAIRKGSGLDGMRLRPTLLRMTEGGMLERLPVAKPETYRLLTSSGCDSGSA